MLTILINLLIMCAVVGVIYWITTLIPMPAPIRVVAQVIVGIIALIMLLGLVGWIPGMRFGHLPG